jgi:transcriptional regulator
MSNLLVGHTTPTTARIWTRGERKTKKAELSYRARGTGAWKTKTGDLEEHRGYVHVFDLDGLTGDTEYELDLVFKPAGSLTPTAGSGRFRTAPSGPQGARFLLGSCNSASPLTQASDHDISRSDMLDHAMKNRELKKGSAELLILSLVEDRPRHGYEISKLIEARSRGAMRMNAASLYPLLYRLERRGLVQGRWVEKAGERRRRFYRLTAEGRKALVDRRRDFADFVAAVELVSGAARA